MGMQSYFRSGTAYQLANWAWLTSLGGMGFFFCLVGLHDHSEESEDNNGI